MHCWMQDADLILAQNIKLDSDGKLAEASLQQQTYLDAKPCMFQVAEFAHGSALQVLDTAGADA